MIKIYINSANELVLEKITHSYGVDAPAVTEKLVVVDPRYFGLQFQESNFGLGIIPCDSKPEMNRCIYMLDDVNKAKP